MNAPHSVSISRRSGIAWERVTGRHYIMRPEDFPEGCGVLIGPNGVLGMGKNKLGRNVTIPLYRPLCDSCDKPIPTDGRCVDCHTYHLDVAARNGL